MADLGITWDPFDVSLLQPSSVDRVRHRFRSQFPEIIWNTAALEGNTLTLPEVQSLLDGVAVGGKRMADEQQVLALSDAYNRLDEMIGSGEFRLDKSISDELHSLVAVHEAIESGHFRGEGQVTGGGSVRLSSGGVVPGIEHGDGGRDLLQHYRTMVEALERVDDPRRRAFLYFAAATRRQFYFDGNKRTARLMMSGTLLAHGFDAVNVTYARRLEFNEALDAMFTTDDATALLRFFGNC